MIRIAVCDDDIQELEKTCALVHTWLNANLTMDGSLQSFSSGFDLSEFILTRGCFDLYLLDVLMQGQDGIALGRAIRERDSRGAIIYLTSSADFAVQAYGLRAFHYLLKPFGAEQLYPVLDEFAAGYLQEQGAILPIRTLNGIIPVHMMDLTAAELRRRTVLCYMADGSMVESQTLRGSFNQFIEPLLQDSRFLKVGASFAVNLSFVTALSGREFQMKNGRHILIPRSVLSQVRDAYISYLFERGRG